MSSGKATAQDAERCDIGPSKFLSKLAQVKGRPSQGTVLDPITRTSAFSDTSRPKSPAQAHDQSCGIGSKRDGRLALVEELERGPYEFTPLSDDPDFKQLEPHSEIRLS